MKSGFSGQVLLLMLLFNSAFGADLNSLCYMVEGSQKVEGVNINNLSPIASVSKLVTSYWAVKTKGLEYRFNTVMYVTPISADGQIFDLHLQGSRDPYFGAERFHLLISELNKRGITKIRNLSFDENFKYMWFVDDPESNKSIATGFYTNSSPSEDEVQKQLRAYARLTQGYEETFERAKKLNIEMVEKPDFSVENIEFIKADDFKPTRDTKMYSVVSRKMSTLLKEMNRNSNNYAANQIFEHLGSVSEFESFIKSSLNLDKQSIMMLNGSGDRVDTAQGARYSSATCSAMIKIIADLHATLSSKKSSFRQIMTVVGTDPGTATDLYNNPTTFDSVVAKTGTVNPAVTLAGVALTKNGMIYFMINASPEGNFSQARNLIRKELVEIIEKNGGPSKINGQGFTFFSFDSKTFSELEVPQESKP